MNEPKKSRPLSGEEIRDIESQTYWINPHKLRVISPDPMLYPRSLWNKVMEEYEKANKRGQGNNEGWKNTNDSIL